MANPVASYQDFIAKAYIEPIRTVTIIDDGYPTIDSLIKRQIDPSQAVPQEENLPQLAALISMCRDGEHSWGVDVYDGHNPDISNSKHINNSDLIILDYNLDPGSPTSGVKARNCLKMLATNNHFNLVIVHTSGVDIDIKDVFGELLASLVYLPQYARPPNCDLDDIEQFFDELSVNDEALYQRLVEAADKLQAIKIFEGKDFNKPLMKPGGLYETEKLEILSLLKDYPIVKAADVVWWLAKNKLESLQGIIDNVDLGVNRWDYSNDLNWIASGKVFVTVVKKRDEEEEVKRLPLKLLEALKGFDPSPLLLLMARMRFELEEHGLLEAVHIASQTDVQAAWLHQLLSADESSKTVLFDRILKNQWSGLANATKPRLKAFSQRMLAVLGGDARESINRFFGEEILNDKQRSLLALNTYSCSRAVSSNYLTTGHVLEFGNGETNEKLYWVCLSPACDLVPDREKAGWRARLGSTNMPFKAVRLNTVASENALENVTSNNYIFLLIDEHYKCFEIPHGKSEHPQWEQMFTSSSGYFTSNNTLTIQRVEEGESSLLEIKPVHNVRVVSELRYEYALNLLQRLGSTLSRVGLDYEKKLW